AEFAAALDDLLATTGTTRASSSTWKTPRHGIRLPAAVGLATLAGAALWLGSTAINRHPDEASPHLDTARYAVLPIEQTGAVARAVDVDRLLRDALGQWSGIAVVDQFATRDRMATVKRPLSGPDVGRVAISLN